MSHTLKVVDRVLTDSELRELWEEADSLDEWTAEVAPLKTRLTCNPPTAQATGTKAAATRYGRQHRERNQMTDDELIALVRTYFAAVDAEDLDGVLDTLALDCKFTVETHGIALNGHHELRGMYERLWANHAAMVHDWMSFVPDAASGRIAAQFRVVNTEHDGSTTIKSNCNFFTAKNNRFSRVQVYMTGETTLDRATEP